MVPQKKQTDLFCSQLLKLGNPVWSDLADACGLDSKELNKIILAYDRDISKLSSAKKYFVEQLRKTLAKININTFEEFKKEPGSAQKRLEFGSEKYSLNFKRYQRQLAFSTLEVARNVLKNHPDLYEMFLEQLSMKISADEVVRIEQILSDYGDNQ